MRTHRGKKLNPMGGIMAGEGHSNPCACCGKTIAILNGIVTRNCLCHLEVDRCWNCGSCKMHDGCRKAGI